MGAVRAAEGERAHAELGGEQAREVPWRVPEAVGEPGHALALDDPRGR
jgi:hypothetical protein